MIRIAGVKAVFAAIALLAGGSLAAQPEGASQSADNIEASAGELRIIHLWSRDPDQFMTAWRGPTPPNLPISSIMERNQVIQQFVLYANCTRNEAGECHVSATVDIFAPDGTRYGDQLAYDVVKGANTAAPGNIGMAEGGIGLRVEDGEQLGRYRVELRASDHVSGLTAVSIVHLEAVEEGSLSEKPS